MSEAKQVGMPRDIIDRNLNKAKEKDQKDIIEVSVINNNNK